MVLGSITLDSDHHVRIDVVFTVSRQRVWHAFLSITGFCKICVARTTLLNRAHIEYILGSIVFTEPDAQ